MKSKDLLLIGLLSVAAYHLYRQQQDPPRVLPGPGQRAPQTPPIITQQSGANYAAGQRRITFRGDQNRFRSHQLGI